MHPREGFLLIYRSRGRWWRRILHRRKGLPLWGTGVVNIPGVLKELDRQSVEYACVEQDIMRNLNPREALTMSYLAMKESGYVW